jgi:hypothetical protein
MPIELERDVAMELSLLHSLKLTSIHEFVFTGASSIFLDPKTLIRRVSLGADSLRDGFSFPKIIS